MRHKISLLLAELWTAIFPFFSAVTAEGSRWFLLRSLLMRGDHGT